MSRRGTFYTICPLLALSFGFSMVLTSTAFAEDTTFTQQILPLNCVFQVVDVGTQTLRYITPAACGQIVTQPQTQGNSSSNSKSKSSTNQFNPNRQIFFVSTNSNSAAKSPSQKNSSKLGQYAEFWKPLVNIGENAQAQVSKPATSTAFSIKSIITASAGVLGLIILVALAIILV